MNVTTKKVARKNIEGFLLEMKEILCNPNFKIERDFSFAFWDNGKNKKRKLCLG